MKDGDPSEMGGQLDERDEDEDAAAPPAQLGQQVAGFALAHERIGRRRGTAE